jgi:hypothetical protein
MVLVHLDADQRLFHITWEGHLLKQLPIQGLYGERLDFEVYLTLMRAEARRIAAHHRWLWGQAGGTA